MPPAIPLQPDDEDYDSSADSDFAGSLSPSTGGEEDTSADEAAGAKLRPKKRKVEGDGDVEMGSGDEGIIAQGRKKRRKKKGKGKGKKKAKDGETQEVDEDDDDDETSGIRVRLRSGRGGQEKTKKSASKTSTATADIDSVWARMNAPPTIDYAPPPVPSKEGEAESSKENKQPLTQHAPAQSEETITIPTTYTYAGTTYTKTKTVPASSPEALAYLQSKEKQPTTSTSLRRPLARKNLLDPNPTITIRGVQASRRADLPPTIGGVGAVEPPADQKENKGWKWKTKKDPKLNTVEKSKLDWEAEVERQGIREELEKADKAQGSYLGRMEFLGRMDEGREERERAVRLATKGS